jgi:hypothetical protein
VLHRRDPGAVPGLLGPLVDTRSINSSEYATHCASVICWLPVTIEIVCQFVTERVDELLGVATGHRITPLQSVGERGIPSGQNLFKNANLPA